MSSGKLDVLVPRPPTAVRLPVPLILESAKSLMHLVPLRWGLPHSVGTGEVGGCEGVGGISVGIGASVGDETSCPVACVALVALVALVAPSPCGRLGFTSAAALHRMVCVIAQPLPGYFDPGRWCHWWR